MDEKKPDLSQLKTALLSRGLSLAKASIKASQLAASQFGRSGAGASIPKEILQKQVEVIAKELGQLKGSAMKVGQLLSTYGENFLPPEVNEILKTLQHQSPPLAWERIEPLLQKELGPRYEDFDFEPVALASASIGQVHLGTRRSDGRKFAFKVQYPGVDTAIETDLKFLKLILGLLRIIPKGARFDQIFDEIRGMLHQEVDYKRELFHTQKFRELLADEAHVLVPEAFEEYSTSKLLVTEYMDGIGADDPAVQSLSLERRDRLGLKFFEVYLRELLEFHLMQTDPHLGNYKIQIDENGEDRLVLLDFGATRAIPDQFLKNYVSLMSSALTQDRNGIQQAGLDLGLLEPDDPEPLVRLYVDVCLLITEPFAMAPGTPYTDTEGRYDFSASDLPRRVAQKASQLALKFKLRAPPKELVFLDRKLGGVFVYLSVLKCHLCARPLLEEHLHQHPG